jgi:hypothetical protein
VILSINDNGFLLHELMHHYLDVTIHIIAVAVGVGNLCGVTFYSDPRQRRQKILMAVNTIGKPQEEGVMSTSTIFTSVRNQGLLD